MDLPTQETKIGDCDVCGEPIIYYPGHYLKCAMWEQDWTDGTNVKTVRLYRHWKCRMKGGDVKCIASIT